LPASFSPQVLTHRFFLFFSNFISLKAQWAADPNNAAERTRAATKLSIAPAVLAEMFDGDQRIFFLSSALPSDDARFEVELYNNSTAPALPLDRLVKLFWP
jgi:hypothetical protein